MRNWHLADMRYPPVSITNTEHCYELWLIWKVFANCDRNWTKGAELCRFFKMFSSVMSTADGAWRVTHTHPHTSFQTDFREDGPQWDFSLERLWPHSFHTHLLSTRIWCWCFLLGTNYLFWIRWLGEIHRAALVGRQGHRCYVWSQIKEESVQASAKTHRGEDAQTDPVGTPQRLLLHVAHILGVCSFNTIGNGEEDQQGQQAKHSLSLLPEPGWRSSEWR